MIDENVFSMRDVTKSYPGKVVLDRLDFDVPAGSVVGLLGKNGAGKTTLIKCGLGLIKPQGGSITVLGESAWELSAAAKSRIGYVPQTVELYPWMKVRQMIVYTASFYPRWNHSLVDRLAADWELPLEDRIAPLSVGSKQKLGILLAVGHEPDLLILDEPAASLDPAARREFLATVLQLADDGRRTVLFSTHITSDIERVADRVAILKDGKIIYHDDLDALKDQVKRLHVRCPRPLPERIDLPGVLRQRVQGDEATLSVRDNVPQAVRWIEAQLQASVEVQDLNLEDIFLEIHDG
jgi:ABC-2 type transport system ATP-binding protein